MGLLYMSVTGETLLDMADCNHSYCLKTLLCVTSDEDRVLNIAAYLSQQAMELLLKHLLEISGVPYKKTHDIVELADMLPHGVIPDALKNELIDRGDTITKLETKTRDLKNFRPAMRNVEYSNNLYERIRISLDSTDGIIHSMSLED